MDVLLVIDKILDFIVPVKLRGRAWNSIEETADHFIFRQTIFLQERQCGTNWKNRNHYWLNTIP